MIDVRFKLSKKRLCLSRLLHTTAAPSCWSVNIKCLFKIACDGYVCDLNVALFFILSAEPTHSSHYIHCEGSKTNEFYEHLLKYLNEFGLRLFFPRQFYCSSIPQLFIFINLILAIQKYELSFLSHWTQPRLHVKCQISLKYSFITIMFWLNALVYHVNWKKNLLLHFVSIVLSRHLNHHNKFKTNVNELLFKKIELSFKMDGTCEKLA